MRMFNKILVSGISFLTLFALMNPTMAEEKKEDEASSKPEAILFRIENIKPIANKDGLIDKCNFMVTAFNRMDKAVKEAKLNFKWTDNISGKYVIDGSDIKVKSGNDAKTVVNANITLSDIAPHTQKSFETSVDTDKCFLLFDNLEYTVESCMNEGDKVEIKNSKVVSKTEGCKNNFDYIDSKNPEYYSEFKDVPESVIAKQAEDEKNNEVAKISENYQNTIKDLQKAVTTLDSIK